ncbi:MAG: hypothetical protein QOD99_52 [Chthoniobacter sp.]|jgi:hypothetical protein|nr:hypothetical protein [Chthoniobacter sp.]
MKTSAKIFAVLGLFAAAWAFTVQPVYGVIVAIGTAQICAPQNRRFQLGAQGALAGPITLLDLAIRNGENVGIVVEEVITSAPELGVIPAVRRQGTSYDVLRRVGLPAGTFRNVGEGVAMSKSQWQRETKPMYLFDAQMLIGEDIVKAQTAQSMATAGDVLADEAIATVRGSTLNLSSQIYYGAKADAKGFAGLATQFSDEVNAGGGANTTSVYLGWLDPSETNPQGVHLSLGLGGEMNFGEWARQQVDMGNGKKAMAWVNGMMFYIGLGIASANSVWRARGVDLAHPFTDALGAQVLAKVPIARRQNLRWFMNRTAAFTLQNARASVSIATPGIPGGGTYPALPSECQGIPITWTDSLLDTETNGNLP